MGTPQASGEKPLPSGNDTARAATTRPAEPEPEPSRAEPSRAEPLAPPLPRFSSSDWWVRKCRSFAFNQRPASVAKRSFPGGAVRPAEAAMAGGWRDVAGVRIAPAELHFRDAVPGGCYRAALSVQNRRVESCCLQLLPPRRPQVRGGREGSGGERPAPRGSWPGRAGVTSSRPGSFSTSQLLALWVFAWITVVPHANALPRAWQFCILPSRACPEEQRAPFELVRPSMRCRTLPEDKCISRPRFYFLQFCEGMPAHRFAQLGWSCARSCLSGCKRWSALSCCKWKMLPWVPEQLVRLTRICQWIGN